MLLPRLLDTKKHQKIIKNIEYPAMTGLHPGSPVLRSIRSMLLRCSLWLCGLVRSLPRTIT
jgi:hypothetical protein